MGTLFNSRRSLVSRLETGVEDRLMREKWVTQYWWHKKYWLHLLGSVHTLMSFPSSPLVILSWASLESFPFFGFFALSCFPPSKGKPFETREWVMLHSNCWMTSIQCDPVSVAYLFHPLLHRHHQLCPTYTKEIDKCISTAKIMNATMSCCPSDETWHELTCRHRHRHRLLYLAFLSSCHLKHFKEAAVSEQVQAVVSATVLWLK